LGVGAWACTIDEKKRFPQNKKTLKTFFKNVTKIKKTFVNVELKTLAVIFRRTDKLKCLYPHIIGPARHKES